MPLKFVIQEHHARTHHYDFRLERDGVFKSWAAPKGLPLVGERPRLALEVEDHDLTCGDFEGEIPAGEYGAGRIRIWDRGTYRAQRWDEHCIEVVLNGSQVNGSYRLLRFSRGGPRAWLVFALSTESDSNASPSVSV